MPACAAWGCKTRFGEGKSMHRFPTDVIRRKNWEVEVQRENWNPTSTSYLCSVREILHILYVIYILELISVY